MSLPKRRVMVQLCHAMPLGRFAGDWAAAAASYTAAIRALRLQQPEGGGAHLVALLSNRSAALLRSGQPLLVRSIASTPIGAVCAAFPAPHRRNDPSQQRSLVPLGLCATTRCKQGV